MGESTGLESPTARMVEDSTAGGGERLVWCYRYDAMTARLTDVELYGGSSWTSPPPSLGESGDPCTASVVTPAYAWLLQADVNGNPTRFAVSAASDDDPPPEPLLAGCVGDSDSAPASSAC